MTGIDDRGKALEDKFFHDEELRFKMVSRRRKLLGLWAAGQLHLAEEDSDTYAIDIVKLGTTDSTEGAVVQKILTDFKRKGLAISEEDIRHQLEVCEAEAKAQLLEVH